YIDHLREKELYQPTILKLLMDYTTSTSDRGFQVFYKNPDRIDAVLKKGAAISTTEPLILHEELAPLMKVAKDKVEQPDFDKIYSTVKIKYDSGMAERVILEAKFEWYAFLINKNQQQYWPQFISSRIARIQLTHSDTIQALSTTFN